MLINVNELRCLSLAESQDFDKEGYLFVKQRNDRLFNQWKTEEFIERFVRLKGNLLLIIATKTINDSIEPNFATNSSNDRCLNLIVLEEFSIKLIDESNKYYEFVIELNRNESVRSFHFATICHTERDQWIQTIHLSSFQYLRSLYRTLINELNNLNNKLLDKPIDTNYEPIFGTKSQTSLILSISCHLKTINCHKSNQKLIIFVYYKTIENFWNFLGNTEISSSRNPRFVRCLAVPKTIHSLAQIQLKFNLYSVIETITDTKCLLGESYFTFQINSLNENKSINRLDLKSLVNKQTIGVLALTLSQSSDKSDRNLRRISSFDSIVCNNYINNNNNNNNYLSLNRTESTKFKNKLKQFRTNSLPNICDSIEKMSNFEDILSSDLFTNTICKSFQFSIPKQKTIAFIDEFMSESEISLTFPQIFMNILMNDEKNLMNCITYSIGEVKTEFQRNQMRALECHLRLVNVLTESLNQISVYQTENNFRPSTAKSDLYLQFIPINFHLQRCLISGSDTNLNKAHDIFTVGAFCCHYLGFETGGMKTDLFDPQNNANNIALSKTWNAMKNFFRISSLRDRINHNLDALIDSVENRKNGIHLMLEYFDKVDELCKQIIAILSSKTVEESLAFCESVRGSDSVNVSFERTVSLEETRKTSLFSQRDIRRHKSLPNEEQQEFEPIDLIHLNIKASLISINSKLMNKNIILSRNDFDASKRKLKAAVDSLYRTSSVCYASSALKLDRQQIETFYRLRLRRDMIFTEALTAVVIGTVSKLESIQFIQRAIETRSILIQIESLLSCYAEEMSMLEDMAYAINQINSCVKFIFESSTETSLQPRIEGNSFCLRVIFSVKDFPSSLKSIECSLTVLLFNIGINECATLAETFGSVKLQETINKESYSRLESYINRIFVEIPSVAENMSALKTELMSNRPKNIRILHLSQQIVRNVGGLRFTSCKSAKDRTSMAVTLEEARLCAQIFNINELNEIQWIQNILDTLRREGTRRENTRKNVGIAKYAFNSLQLLTFPKLLRAPAGTYSSIET